MSTSKSKSKYSAKLRALAQHLCVRPGKIKESSYGHDDCQGYECETERGEWMVLTDSEAEERWNESLENYIDECILPECPEPVRSYFDREAWKRDARHDGRGHSLSGYDGEEWDETIDGVTYYIYRTN